MYDYYVFGEIVLTAPDWVRDYVRDINGYIERHGGKVLSRSVNMAQLEGDAPLPTNVILMGFPSKQAAEAFFEDEEYQPLRQRRIAGSVSNFIGFPAEDLAISFEG